MQTTKTTPCSECPFRKESARGWLGPWTPTELLRSLTDTPFPCHKTILEDDQDYNDPTLKGCAGAAIYLNNKLELSRCRETADHQKRLKGSALSTTVFKTPKDFIDHHTI